MAAYEGDILNYCPADVDFSNVQAVIVSGILKNVCGHAILFVPAVGGTTNADGSPPDGLYFQVVGNPDAADLPWWRLVLPIPGQLPQPVLDSVVWYPMAMTSRGYQRYMRESGKTELGRLNYTIPATSAAYNRMIELMQARWAWGVLAHNCATFVEHIIRTGGGTCRLKTCPKYNLPEGQREPR